MKIKQRIHKILFPDIDKIYEDMYTVRLNKWKEEASLKDVFRERMKGIVPNRHADNTILFTHIASLNDNDRLAFLSKAKDLMQNEAFLKISDSLIVESEHKAMIDATVMEEVNFNRATINGVTLIEDSVYELSKMYEEEKYLRDKKMEDGEQFQAI